MTIKDQYMDCASTQTQLKYTPVFVSVPIYNESQKYYYHVLKQKNVHNVWKLMIKDPPYSRSIRKMDEITK